MQAGKVWTSSDASSEMKLMRLVFSKLAVALLVLTSPHQPASAQSIHWTPLGEPGSGGWIVGMRFSPLDSRKLLVTGDMLGVGLSEDGGAGLACWPMHSGDLRIF